MTSVQFCSGLADLAERYDGFIIDLWGVIHDGVQAYPEALDCLARLKAQGKIVTILSNAPRRSDAVIARNSELGIGPEHYDHVLSSGEATWLALKEPPDSWFQALGRRCYQLGPERDWGLREGLDLDFTADYAAADFVLLTGPPDIEQKVEDFEDFLQEGLARKLPMVCANPDLEVMRGPAREICAGAIAARYEEIGGNLRVLGKPHLPVYELCFRTMGLRGGERLVGIGDTLRTDIAGAQAAGMDGIFIADGIHTDVLGVIDGQPLDQDRFFALFDDWGLYPTAALPRLRW